MTDRVWYGIVTLEACRHQERVFIMAPHKVQGAKLHQEALGIDTDDIYGQLARAMEDFLLKKNAPAPPGYVPPSGNV